jgi:hypothetical protein
MLWHMLSSISDYRPVVFTIANAQLVALHVYVRHVRYGGVFISWPSGCNKPIGSPLLHTITQQQHAVKQPPSSSHKVR